MNFARTSHADAIDGGHLARRTPGHYLHDMDASFLAHLAQETAGLRAAGLYKTERVMTSPQAA